MSRAAILVSTSMQGAAMTTDQTCQFGSSRRRTYAGLRASLALRLVILGWLATMACGGEVELLKLILKADEFQALNARELEAKTIDYATRNSNSVILFLDKFNERRARILDEEMEDQLKEACPKEAKDRVLLLDLSMSHFIQSLGLTKNNLLISVLIGFAVRCADDQPMAKAEALAALARIGQERPGVIARAFLDDENEEVVANAIRSLEPSPASDDILKNRPTLFKHPSLSVKEALACYFFLKSGETMPEELAQRARPIGDKLKAYVDSLDQIIKRLSTQVAHPPKAKTEKKDDKKGEDGRAKREQAP
jgi:hypothetical protein